jgi:hypothetical protein
VRQTLAGKAHDMKEWCRHETALFVPCAIAGFTIPFGPSLPMAQHKAVFCLRLTMNEKISYSKKAAEFLGSAVAAILLSYVVKKCEENNTDTHEDVDLQFDIGFSDVEFFSALKILREKGYMQSRTLRGGSRLYVPIPEFFDLRSDQ